MATRDKIIERRVAAVARIKAALPGVRFDPLAHRGGPEYREAADLEAVADALERTARPARKAQPEFAKG